MNEDNGRKGNRFNPFPRGTRNAMSFDSCSTVGLVLITLVCALSLSDPERRQETSLWYLGALGCAVCWTMLLIKRYRTDTQKGETPAHICQQAITEGLETAAALVAMPAIIGFYIFHGLPDGQELPRHWQLGTIVNTSLMLTTMLVIGTQLRLWF